MHKHDNPQFLPSLKDGVSLRGVMNENELIEYYKELYNEERNKRLELLKELERLKEKRNRLQLNMIKLGIDKSTIDKIFNS